MNHLIEAYSVISVIRFQNSPFQTDYQQHFVLSNPIWAFAVQAEPGCLYRVCCVSNSHGLRRSGVVASADLLPLDASVIPESCAPQLRRSKKSPSVQLGADVMSKREQCWEQLGSGDATKSKPSQVLRPKMIACAVFAMIIACFAVNWKEEKPPGNFIRPFQGLSNQKIKSFLSENPSLPVSLEDMRFLRFSDEHQRLVRCLIVPSLFDQRVTLMFARLHSYSNIQIDPALDKLIDTIDESSWLSFLFFAVVSPSYPLYQTVSSVSSESSLDEWFQTFFLLLSFIEAMQFGLFVHEFYLDHSEYGKYPKFSLLNAVISVSKKFFVRPAIVSLLSAFSYRVLWWFTPMPLTFLVSNALIFALPAWYAWQAYRSIKRARKYWDVLRNGTTKEQLEKKIKEIQRLRAEIARLEMIISRLQSEISDLKVQI